MDYNNILTKIAHVSFGGIVGAAISSAATPTKASRFENVSEASTAFVIVFFIIIVMFCALSIMDIFATYKLTDSVFQTIMCFFFGCIYLMIAFVYYGFSGYKFVKRS